MAKKEVTVTDVKAFFGGMSVIVNKTAKNSFRVSSCGFASQVMRTIPLLLQAYPQIARVALVYRDSTLEGGRVVPVDRELVYGQDGC